MDSIDSTALPVSMTSATRALASASPASSQLALSIPFSALLQASLPSTVGLLTPQSLPTETALADIKTALGKLGLGEFLDLLNSSLPATEIQAGLTALEAGLQNTGTAQNSPVNLLESPKPELPAAEAAQINLALLGQLRNTAAPMSEAAQQLNAALQMADGEVTNALDPMRAIAVAQTDDDKKDAPKHEDLSSSWFAEAALALLIPTVQPQRSELQSTHAEAELADPFAVPDNSGNAMTMTLPPTLALPAKDPAGSAEPLVSREPALPQDSKSLALSDSSAAQSPQLTAFSLLSAEFNKPQSALKHETLATKVEPALINTAGSTPLPATPLVESRADVSVALAAPVTPQTPLELHHKGWGIALGQQLVWMVHHHSHQAELKVNPPHLGPLEVHLSLDQAQTSVAFFCHDAGVREAIENALPRLKEMLDNQGIQLSQANVSDQSLARQQQGSGSQLPNPWVWRTEEVHDTGSATDTDQPVYRRATAGVIDHYV